MIKCITYQCVVVVARQCVTLGGFGMEFRRDMKKYIYSLMIIVVAVLGSYLSFHLYRNSLLSTNIEHGSYSKCYCGQGKQACSLDLSLNNHSDSFGVKPLLY